MAEISRPKIYLIMERHFDIPEYSESDIHKCYVSIPIGAATFKEMAEMICKEKAIAEIRSKHFIGFGSFADYDTVSVYRHITRSTFNRTVAGFGLNKDDLSFKKDVSSYSDESLLEILKFFNIEFFKVKEIDLLA